MAARLVCTANSPKRRSCKERCKGCGYLTADRRLSRPEISFKSLCERRLMSNLLPFNELGLAGVNGSVAVPGRTWRQWPAALMMLLISFNLLDALLTARALSLGVAEANPVMAGLINVSIPAGLAAKFLAVSAGALLLWKYRHLPVASRGMSILTFLYGAVILYHVYFQLQAL